MDLHISQVFSICFVLELEVLCSNISDLISVGDDTDFEHIFLVREIGLRNMNRNTTQTLFDDFIVNSGSICSDGRLAFGIRKCAKYKGRNI